MYHKQDIDHKRERGVDKYDHWLYMDHWTYMVNCSETVDSPWPIIHSPHALKSEAVAVSG